jgi:hypothetical protein
MTHEPRKPICLAERREVERAVFEEILETSSYPERGSTGYDIIQVK